MKRLGLLWCRLLHSPHKLSMPVASKYVCWVCNRVHVCRWHEPSPSKGAK